MPYEHIQKHPNTHAGATDRAPGGFYHPRLAIDVIRNAYSEVLCNGYFDVFWHAYTEVLLNAYLDVLWDPIGPRGFARGKLGLQQNATW